MKNTLCFLFWAFVVPMLAVGDLPNKNDSVTELELRKRMVFFSRLHDLRQVQSDFVGDYIKSNNICSRTAASIAESLAKETLTKMDAGKNGILFSQYSRLLALVSKYGDKQNLTFLEQASLSTNRHIRIESASAYIRLAGVESFPFFKNIFTNTIYSGYDRETLIIVFRRMLKNNQELLTPELMDKIHSLYFEILEKENDGGCVALVDKTLCEERSDYKSSLQRLACAMRLQENDNNYYKQHFDMIMNEIEKTPKENRKNFKAKGELLDPDRGK